MTSSLIQHVSPQTPLLGVVVKCSLVLSERCTGYLPGTGQASSTVGMGGGETLNHRSHSWGAHRLTMGMCSSSQPPLAHLAGGSHHLMVPLPTRNQGICIEHRLVLHLYTLSSHCFQSLATPSSHRWALSASTICLSRAPAAGHLGHSQLRKDQDFTT